MDGRSGSLKSQPPNPRPVLFHWIEPEFNCLHVIRQVQWSNSSPGSCSHTTRTGNHPTDRSQQHHLSNTLNITHFKTEIKVSSWEWGILIQVPQMHFGKNLCYLVGVSNHRYWDDTNSRWDFPVLSPPDSSSLIARCLWNQTPPSQDEHVKPPLSSAAAQHTHITKCLIETWPSETKSVPLRASRGRARHDWGSIFRKVHNWLVLWWWKLKSAFRTLTRPFNHISPLNGSKSCHIQHQTNFSSTTPHYWPRSTRPPSPAVKITQSVEPPSLHIQWTKKSRSHLQRLLN